MSRTLRIEIKKVLAEKVAEGLRVISLREAAAEIGVNHIKTDDVYSIIQWFIGNHPDYKAVRMVRPWINVKESIFTTITFIDGGIYYED